MSDQGQDVSSFFTNRGKMMPPIYRVNVDFTQPMLHELDAAARELKISRQAVIKTFLRQVLDQRYLAQGIHRPYIAPGPAVILGVSLANLQ
jgi:hypothetical protein